MEYYSKALTADTAFALAYLGKGMIMLKERRNPVTALAYFDTSIHYDASLWEAYYLRSAARRELGFIGGALSDLSTALSLNPSIAKDTLIGRIDQSVSALSAFAAKLNADIDKGDRSEKSANDLSRTYLALGDSLRARTTAMMFGNISMEWNR
jgi:tetratricopeptide (TPR) repeat protein